MNIASSVNAMAEMVEGFRRDGKRVGLVPTMGYLHEGHVSLIRESATRCEVTVVSIFVNPVQFGANEDFSTYPRDFERDCRLCCEAGVQVVFNPTADEMYAPDRSITVVEERLSAGLCGASRPVHFAGVCTVVAKLFNIVRPDVAVFGQKDAQQLAVIRRMVRDLNFQLEIIGAPIVREPDGLAMSSRNVYLSTADRAQALGLHRALDVAVAQAARGCRNTTSLREDVAQFLRNGYPGVDVEYIAFVDAETLEPRHTLSTGMTLLALAAKVGKTRLIDNVLIP